MSALGLRVLVALACAAATLRSADLYSVRDLGEVRNLPGRDDGGPRAINHAGQIAAANASGGVYQALLYGGAWTNLGTLGGAEALASGVDALGRVVGRSLISSTVTRAFLWTPGGTDGVPSNPQMRDLGVLPGGTSSEATAINGTGQITGYSQDGTHDRAFRYSAGAMTDIGGLLGGKLPHSYGLAINDAGHVVGLAYNKSFTSASAFFYDGITAAEIGRSGDKGASALAISDGDQIAGYLTTSNDFDHAFRHAGGTMVDLGTLGGHYSYGIGINNSNVIVGGSFTDADDLVYHAFIAKSNALVDLNTLLDATGAGWTLVEARAVNDAGQITGVGTRGGRLHAFLLAPAPPPAAPMITSATPTVTGTVGTAYAFQVTATGNPAPNFSATSLPPGLSIDPTTGLISGTPTTAGTFHGAITAANGLAPDALQAFSIIVSAALAAPTITSATPTATGTVGTAYAFQVTATGNPAPAFSATGLPPGLSMNPTTGLMSGTPTTAGTFNGASTAANGVAPDAVQAFSITVSVSPLPAPLITSLVVSGRDVLVSFTTVASATYTLVCCEEAENGLWEDLVSGIPGTGTTMTVTDVGALAMPACFYRVRVDPPKR